MTSSESGYGDGSRKRVSGSPETSVRGLPESSDCGTGGALPPEPPAKSIDALSYEPDIAASSKPVLHQRSPYRTRRMPRTAKAPPAASKKMRTPGVALGGQAGSQVGRLMNETPTASAIAPM